MSRPRFRIPKEVRAVLDECGRPWEVRNGKKHALVYIDGQMVAAVSKSTATRTDYVLKNTVANIRRFCRG